MTQNCGLRGVDEPHQVTNGDIVFGPKDKKNEVPEYLEVKERITKTRRGGKNKVRDMPGRAYKDDDNPEICPVRTILEYQRRKTYAQKMTADYSFLLNVKQSAKMEPEKHLFWYINGLMGHNLIRNLLKYSLEAAGVDIKKQKISTSSTRKNVVQAGADSNVPSYVLSKMVGQKNLDSKLEYLKNKENTHKVASLSINRQITGLKGSDYNEEQKKFKDRVDKC